MSPLSRTISVISGLVLLCSLVVVAAPATPAQAQSTDPCAGIAADKCLFVERDDDPYPVNPNNPTDPGVPVQNRVYQCRTDVPLDCSLRTAILKANALAGTDPVRIVFNINKNSPNYLNELIEGQSIETWRIPVVQPLPALTRNAIEIDGFTQDEFLTGVQNEFGPPIIIDGAGLNQNSRGLIIRSSNNVIRNLAIINFRGVSAISGVGIEIAPIAGNSAEGNIIQGCYLGVNKVGTAPASNLYGVWLQSANNIIGGNVSTNGVRNIISGNRRDGILVSGPANKIQGNYIGIDRRGLNAVPNGTDAAEGGSGIAIRGSSDNVIGPPVTERFSANYGNVISGNSDNGVLIFNGSRNTILGNLIGTDTTGSVAIPNLGDGVQIVSDGEQTTENQVGSPAANPLRNTISGNGVAGVRLQGDANSGNRVQNNYIGLDSSGFVLLPGAFGATRTFNQTGVIIEKGSDSNLIGGAGVGEGNVISGNGGNGVEIRAVDDSDAFTIGNKVLGNFIGLSIINLSPSQRALGNGGNGVFISGSRGTIRDTEIVGNAISASGQLTATGAGHGLYVLTGDSNVINTTVRQNVVGLLGTVAAPQSPSGASGPSANDGDGIRFESSGTPMEDITIGGADYAQRNIVSGNLGNGINILGPNEDTTLLRNTVQANTLNGITVQSAVRAVVDGQADDDAAPNLVTTNGDNGIRFTDSTTVTVRYYRVIQNGDNGITVSSTSEMSDVLIENNRVLTNTLDGITGTGASVNTFINGNIVRGHGGSGIRWDGPARDTEINSNTVYTNTLLAAPESHGIWLGPGERATINDNRVRGNTNGAGIVMGRMLVASISANPEVERNGQEGIRVTAAEDTQVAGNTVVSNTLLAGLGGIALTGTDDSTVSGNTVRGHLTRPGIALAGATDTLLPANTVTRNLRGLDLSGGRNTAVQGGSYSRNALHGLLITDTQLMTVTQGAQLSFNGGSGARIVGNTVRANISGSSVLSNTVDGIHLGAGGAGPHPREVQILDNSISGNGIPVNSAGVPTIPLPVAQAYQGFGIVFDPVGPPLSDSNPNRDITPPLQVALGSNGVVTGRIDPEDASGGCYPPDKCLVQVFRANPRTRDGQGRDKLGQGFADATGLFTVTVGTLPVQLALTATDGDGNTSRFGLFTGSPDLTISPPRTGSARPGQVITYTHEVANTGNMTFTNLKLSATSSRGWDQITLIPPDQFALRPGETKTVTVSVKLPIGTDPRVVAGPPPDSLTVSVEGSVQFEGQSPTVVRRSVVDVTTVEARVVIEVVPGSLAGRGLPGTTLPYVHTVRNNGNITATVSLAASTDLGPQWTTTLSPTGNITIPPGRQQVVQMLVTIPPRSTGVTSGTVALTRLQVTTVNPVDVTQNRTITDTTTVTLDQLATLIADEVRDGAAGVVTPIPHRATNLSNGRATFRLLYTSSLGSTITFQSQTPGVTITGNNTFTLGTQADGSPPNKLDFIANVRVNSQALAGQKDSIIIYLVDDKGNVIGGAFVSDTINVTRSAVAPRLYLPVIFR